MSKNGEYEWQKFRKKRNQVSNILDGNYETKRGRAWWPNGEYIVKKRYNYTESGLEHIYEKNNVEQKRPIDDIPPNLQYKQFIRNFVEYDTAKDGEYIISIEYCSSCEEHSNITHHSNDVFKDLAYKYQTIIKERFPFINVILKPVDVDIVKNERYKLPTLRKNGGIFEHNVPINDKFKQCRIGAFEIQISTMIKGRKNIKMIHSKLKTKKFPKVKDVLDKIVS